MALSTLIVFTDLIASFVLWKYRAITWLIPIIILLCLVGSYTLTMTGHYGGQILYEIEQVKRAEHPGHEHDDD